MQLPGQLGWTLKDYAQAEIELVSVERISEYAELESEAADERSSLPDKSWPAHGGIECRGVTMSYRAELGAVISELSFDVPAGSKVAVLGRTGSGKSSLALILTQLYAHQRGAICVDGMALGSLPHV